MKTAKQAFEEFISESSSLERKMRTAVMDAHNSIIKSRHPGAFGGFKPFSRSLQLLQQCSVHLPDYTKEQIALLYEFNRKITAYLVDPSRIGLVGPMGYLNSKIVYYNSLNAGKDAAFKKTSERQMRSHNMHVLFSGAVSRLETTGGSVGTTSIRP